MNTAQEFNRLYDDVACNIEKALIDIEKINVENEEGKQQLSKIVSHFKNLQERFNSKLTFLEKHAEWDKFTLAFFGETNAGKSTILESLRILFHENSREKLVKLNQSDLENSEKELNDALNSFQTVLMDTYTDLSKKIIHICAYSDAIQKIVEEESAMRLNFERDEIDARIQLELSESETRMQILKEQTTRKNRLKLLTVSLSSFVLGVSLMAVFCFMVR